MAVKLVVAASASFGVGMEAVVVEAAVAADPAVAEAPVTQGASAVAGDGESIAVVGETVVAEQSDDKTASFRADSSR